MTHHENHHQPAKREIAQLQTGCDLPAAQRCHAFYGECITGRGHTCSGHVPLPDQHPASERS